MDLIITDNDNLKKLCNQVSQASYIAIDTEFVRVNTFYPELSLVQISDGNIAFAIDMLVDMDFQPLLELLQNQALPKIIHSAKQDLEVLYNKFGQLPVNIFDTQIACQFLGFDPPPSYDNMVNHFLGIKLDKKLQFSNWLERPITKEKLIYALDDVIHLHKVAEKIFVQLETRKRYDWVQEENQILASNNNFIASTEELLNKFVTYLNTDLQFAQALYLIQLREREVRLKNVIRRKIFPDDDITLFITKNHLHPRVKKYLTHNEIQQLGNIQPDEKSEAIISRVIKRKSYKGLEKNEKFKQLKALLETIAINSQISANIIATSEELLKFVHGFTKNTRFLKGWRYEVYGQYAEKV